MVVEALMTRLQPYALAWLLFPGAGAAGAADPFAGLDAYVEDAMKTWEVPGLAIAVVKDGETVLARGYGVCELGGHRAVTADTVFPIASCTKSFTAACVGMLVDEGKVGWDDPVRKHLPGFEVADPHVSRHATLRDLLCHRTGLVRGDLLFVKGDLEREEVLRRTKFLEQAAPFRTRVTYSNLMYAVLGEVIAGASGIPWEQFVAERIFAPLALASTAASRAAFPAERLAVRHRRYDGRVEPLRKPTRDDLVAPAGAVVSTVADMAQWLKFQLREGKHQDRRCLEAGTVREMHALHQSIPITRQADGNVYEVKVVGTGLGWWVRDYRGRKVVQHGGGWGAETALVPEENLAVVVLSNLDHNLLVQMLVHDVMDAYFVGPERAWTKAGKWDHWLAIGGPGHMEKFRNEQWAELDKARVQGTRPALALEAYAGRYASDLYGILDVKHEAGRLAVRFGDHAAELAHWQDDTFTGRAVVEPFLDWLVKFQVEGDRAVGGLEIVHVGWKDPDERHLFRRTGPESFADFYAQAIPELLAGRFAGGRAGMVVGLLDERGGRVFGAGSLDNGTDRTVDGDTIFELGSVTKVFTALLLLDAVRRGEVGLDDPVGKYLPDRVRAPDHRGRQITLRNLAAQDSGLPWHPDNLRRKPVPELSLKELKLGSDAFTVEDLYAFLSAHALARDPGRRFQYSNVGMALLGHTLERRTGSDYEALVRERICRPLAMEHTRIALSPEMKARLARGHLLDGTPSEHLQFKAMASAGGFLSTANDLLKFLAANLGFTGSELTPLLETMQVIRHTGAERFGKTAMPWFDEGIYNPLGSELLAHGGGGFGNLAFLGFDRLKRRGVVVLTNQMEVNPQGVGWTILQGLPLTRENITYFVREVVGIGIALDGEGTGMPRITTVYPQSPAGRAGLAAGVLLRRVDGTSVEGKSAKECLELIRGPVEARVRLEVFDPEREAARTIDLEREKFLTATGDFRR
jgi:CubicO group peptidase (beta-lactamase class C family)